MAKKVVATLKKEGAGKSFTKCIKMVKNEKTGAYSFKSGIISAEQTKDFFENK